VVVAVDIGGRVWLFGPSPEMIRMSFATLAGGDLLVSIIGPLLALPQRWHLPVTLGEESWPPGSCWGRLAATPAGAQRDVHVPG
jgi:hypothetical protein